MLNHPHGHLLPWHLLDGIDDFEQVGDAVLRYDYIDTWQQSRSIGLITRLVDQRDPDHAFFGKRGFLLSLLVLLVSCPLHGQVLWKHLSW